MGAPASLEDFGDEEQVWPRDEPRRVREVQNHAVYAAMVETLDTSVGRILDRLDALDLAENTIVVFFSDNGGLSTAEGAPTSEPAATRRQGLALRGRHPGAADRALAGCCGCRR